MPDRLLTSEEAARKLGVKPATLYAYVSRGLLVPERSATSRRSLFHADDLERLALRSRGESRGGGRLASITTSVTELSADGPVYRGVPVAELVGRGFESVCQLLWRSGKKDFTPVAISPVRARAARDRIRMVVLSAGEWERLRGDLDPEVVTRQAAAVIATVAERLYSDPGRGQAPVPVAVRVARQIGGGRPPEALAEAVDAALVLLADHELATSTLAVRIAASTRADLYDALLAGLGVLAGPLHAGASALCYDLVATAMRDGPERALSDVLRWRGAVPGFGHAIYEGADPRFAPLVRYLERLSEGRSQAAEATAELVSLAAEHGLPGPNVDLALGALVLAAGARRESGEALFSLSRLSGFVAHYLEELEETPLRFRSRAIYGRGDVSARPGGLEPPRAAL